MAYRVLSGDGQAIVVVFDMCSSSNIVDELGKAGNVKPLTVFFGEMRRYLTKAQKRAVPFELYKFMGGQQEYFGRAINVACRLQAALKDKGGSPACSALISNRVYRQCFADTTPHRVHKVTRKLRNIDDGADFECRRLRLVRPFDSSDEPA